MEEKLIELLSDVLNVPINQLSVESSTENVEEWDSLKHMNVIFAIEDAFGITIPDELLAETTSVKSLMSVMISQDQAIASI